MKIEDIGIVLQHMNLKLESKEPVEHPEDGSLRRFKDKWLFMATLFSIALALGVCMFFLILQPNSTYTGSALNGLIGLTMALAGYYVRGKAN